MHDSNNIRYSDKGIPPEKWVTPKVWNKFVESMPVACTDLLFEREDGSILLAYRIIEPYKNVWALIGGRLLYRESLSQAAKRIAKEYGLSFRELFMIGVYSTSFQSRSTISIALAAVGSTGENLKDGKEFSRFAWMTELPRNLGTTYRHMITKWKMERRSKDVLMFNRLL